METEENKDLVRRFYQEAIRERDAGACERLLSVDFVHNGEGRGQRRAVGGTGRRVEFTSTALLRVRDGLIVQARDEIDSEAILNQLGA